MSRGLGVLAALLLFACGAKEEQAQWFDATKYRYQPTREALALGISADDFVRCDIRDEDCQVRLFDATAKEYGADAPRPPTSIVTPEEFDQYEQDMLTPDQLIEGASREDVLFRVLWLLGLISPDLAPDDVSAGSVGSANSFGRILAAYFFIPKEVLVIDWRMAMDDPESVLTLSHEYTHALQDDEYDLTKLHDAIDTTDESQGLLGLVEGEAELYATLVSRGYVTEDRAKWKELRKAVIADAVNSPAPFLVASINFPYTIGNEFATFTWLSGGNQAAADLYGAVPKSARQILAGGGAKTPPDGWVDAVDDTGKATLAAGFRAVEIDTSKGPEPFEDSFGAWILHVFLEVLAAPDDPVKREKYDVRLPGESVATDLRGDQVVAFERDDGMVVVWRMRFEPDAAPSDVIAEIEADAPDNFRLRVEHGDVLLFAGESADALDEFVSGFALPGTNAGGVSTGQPAAP